MILRFSSKVTVNSSGVGQQNVLLKNSQQTVFGKREILLFLQSYLQFQIPRARYQTPSQRAKVECCHDIDAKISHSMSQQQCHLSFMEQQAS